MKFMGPWIIGVSAYSIAYRLCLPSMENWNIVYSIDDASYYLLNRFNGKGWKTLDEAKSQIDEWMRSGGYVDISQDRFDRLSLLA